MKNLPSEFVDINNPLCLYCKSICIKKFNETKSVLILSCKACNEKIYFPIKGLSFGFTCINLICSLDFIKNTISISRLDLIINEIAAEKFITNTVPMFDINFSNKEKLNNKLNTYLSFS